MCVIHKAFLFDGQAIPLSFSAPPERKLVVIDSFSEVVYLDKIAGFLTLHGSNVLSKPPLLDCKEPGVEDF